MRTDGGSLRPTLYAGTYGHADGAGLYPLHRSADGHWSISQAYGDAQNASFGTYSARHGVYYFVDERSDGVVGAYQANAGGWRRLAEVPTGGEEPCHVALNAAEDRLAVANYGSGSIALLALDDTGVPLGSPAVRLNSGRGAVPDRQDGPHAHCACFSPDQQWLYQVDLGTDQILGFRVGSPGANLGERQIPFTAPAGSGPRHLVFHPARPQALLVSELASTLTLLEWDDDTFSARATLSTLPQDFTGESLGGHLSLNRAGDHVYVTNRGHDSVAVFAWADDGMLSLLQHIASGGTSPRAFVLLEEERQLVVAHEESANITVFDVASDGRLSATGANLPLPGAVFLIAAL